MTGALSGLGFPPSLTWVDSGAAIKALSTWSNSAASRLVGCGARHKFLLSRHLFLQPVLLDTHLSPSFHFVISLRQSHHCSICQLLEVWVIWVCTLQCGYLEFGHPTIDDLVCGLEPFQALLVNIAAGCTFIQKKSVVVKLSLGLLASIQTCLVPVLRLRSPALAF